MLVPFATASRRTPLFYIAIHQVSLLSHAACAIAIAIDVSRVLYPDTAPCRGDPHAAEAPMPLTHPCRFWDMPLRPHLVGRVGRVCGVV